MRSAASLAAAFVLAGLGLGAAPARGPLFAAFYVPWEPAALASLKAHVGQVDVFAPAWASLVSPKGELRWETDPEAHAVLAAAARKPRVLPMVSNAHDDVWDVAAAQGVIANDAAAGAFVSGLVQRAQAEGFGGYVMDFENLPPASLAAYPKLLAKLHQALKAQGRELWVTETLSTDPELGKALAAATDAVVLMAYDQCWATSTPGPIADDAWLRQNLSAKLAGEDRAHVVVALASYGYDWPQGKSAAVIAAGAARDLAARKAQPVASAPGSDPHFGYRGQDGAAHQVWFVDGATFARQRALAEALLVRGVALWRMGLEDPPLWRARASAPSPAGGQPAVCTPLPH